MLVELGNPAPLDDGKSLDIGPAVTYISLPESDEESGQVGYDFDPSLDVATFKTHLVDAILTKDGTTSIGSEAAVALAPLWTVGQALKVRPYVGVVGQRRIGSVPW